MSRKWRRGAKATSRALQFPGVMEVRGEAMWCKFCNVPVDFKEKCTAANHVICKKHAKNVQEKPNLVEEPGATAILTSEPKQEAVEAESQPAPKKQKTADIMETFSQMNTKEHISEDFLAAFLQAGIPPSKLDHPSIRGLIGKYTKV